MTASSSSGPRPCAGGTSRNALSSTRAPCPTRSAEVDGGRVPSQSVARGGHEPGEVGPLPTSYLRKQRGWAAPRLGVASRLLLAFLGICGLAVIGAGAAIFSFHEIGEVLDRITARR